MLNDLFRLVRSADQPQALRLLDVIRSNASAEEIRGFIDQTLGSITSPSASTSASAGPGPGQGASAGAAAGKDDQQETVTKLEDIRRLISLEGTSPTHRRKVMDIHYLCDEAPQRVPAKPWTPVSDDDDLVSHLLSLYLAWNWPVHGFLDPDVLQRHMRAGDVSSELCSPFLVNAVLANACVSFIVWVIRVDG